MKATFRGFAVTGQVKNTIGEMEKIYKETDRTLSFSWVKFTQRGHTLEENANEFAQFVTQTPSPSVRDLWSEPRSRSPPGTQFPMSLSQVLD
jgi:hypothetical protein